MKIGYWFLIKLILICAILTVMVWNTDLAGIPRLLGSIDAGFLPIAFLLYFCMFIIGSIRYKVVLNLPVKLRILLPVSILQNITNQFMPAHAGDVSYMMLLKKTSGVTLGRSFASLLMIRLYDLIVIGLLLIASTILLDGKSGTVMTISVVSGVFLAVLLLVVSLLIKYLAKVVSGLKWLAGSFGLSKVSFAERLMDGADDTADAVSVLNSRRKVAEALFLSFIFWTLPLTMSYVIFTHVFGLPVTFCQVFYLYTVLTIFSVVPIHFLGGLGTMDAGIAALLVMFGIMNKSDSIAFSLSLRIISYLYAAICMLFAFLALKIERAQNTEVVVEKMYDDEHLNS
ncbi:MAG: flippase-like domain-containing protein [Planctomycetes bacterium]|nr:flippase-like domain-containing protein [Planctomycetota bacterium]